MAKNQIVAAVDSVKGQAFVRDQDGAVRPLNVGDPLYEGETLVADPGSHVVVAPDDGATPYHIDGPLQLAMAQDIPADDAEIDPGTLADIIEKFKNLEDLPPPEAGGGGGSRPHNFVVLERIFEVLDPMDVEFNTPTFRDEGPFQWLNISASAGGGGDGDPPPPPPPVPDNYEVVEASITQQHSVLDNDPGNYVTVAKVVIGGVEYDVPAGGLEFMTELRGGVKIMPDGTFTYVAPVRDHGGRGYDSDGPG
ncbi:MAG: retention module-containing protein, partial [Betaproteobacteria bacterium]|nr:retention module-containing protein [Betaproteobacteria bacterium]